MSFDCTAFEKGVNSMWCIEYIPENDDRWQHAYCGTEEEANEAVEFLEKQIRARVTAMFELDY